MVYSAEQQRWNGGSNGSVSVSRKGASEKEAARLLYQTWDSGSGNGILTGRIGHGILAADMDGSRHRKEQKVVIITNRK